MSKNWPKSTKWAISRMLFHQQTSYLVPRYNPIRHIQWPKCRWPWPKVKVKGQGQIFNKKMCKKTKNCSYLGGYFTHRLHHIYYHSFLWLIWALPSCWTLRLGFPYVQFDVCSDTVNSCCKYHSRSLGNTYLILCPRGLQLKKRESNLLCQANTIAALWIQVDQC